MSKEGIPSSFPRVAGKGSVRAFKIPCYFDSSIPNGTNFAMKAGSADDRLGGAHIPFSQSKESREVGEGICVIICS